MRMCIDTVDNSKGSSHTYLYASRWWFQVFFHVHPYLGKWSNLTNIFQGGWNHQLDMYISCLCFVYDLLEGSIWKWTCLIFVVYCCFLVITEMLMLFAYKWTLKMFSMTEMKNTILCEGSFILVGIWKLFLCHFEDVSLISRWISFTYISFLISLLHSIEHLHVLKHSYFPCIMWN